MTKPPIDNVTVIQAADELPPEKKFYFNGFTVAMTPMDCVIILLHNNRPIAFLNAPHTIAKTMGFALDALVKDFEEKSGQQVLKLDELNAKLEHNES